MFVKSVTILIIVRELMNLTDSAPNVVVLSPQKQAPFFTTVNSLFLKHFISSIMFLRIRMVSVAVN
jgi:hypothetical protein